MNDINQHIVTLTPAAARPAGKRVDGSEAFQSGKPASSPPPAPTARENEKAARELDKKQVDLEAVAREMDKFIPDAQSNTKLRIDKDESTGRFVYKGVNSDTGEVVKQFPAEDVLAVIRSYREVAGLVIDGEV